MSGFERAYVAEVARRKIEEEATRGDENLRVRVGHTSLLVALGHGPSDTR